VALDVVRQKGFEEDCQDGRGEEEGGRGRAGAGRGHGRKEGLPHADVRHVMAEDGEEGNTVAGGSQGEERGVETGAPA